MSKGTKAINPQIHQLTVTHNEQISENLHRITVAGDSLADFHYQGFDQWFRLFLSRPGQDALHLPSSPSLWFPQYIAMSSHIKPYVRNYTVRHFRADHNELDIDMFTHGMSSPASSWAQTTKPGDKLGLLDQGCRYVRPEDLKEVFIIADETAVPAALGIIESESPQTTITAILEVPDKEDIQTPHTSLESVTIHWITRDGKDSTPGELALARLGEVPAISDSTYVFAAGESNLATSARRIVHSNFNVPKKNITFVGYWKKGRAASS